ncbi:hypothetical protein DLJ53_33740 [Acuticoccus sediminis]|uniref:Uncharacterized protein n=1 Tax=Acuticoccus sediminis TaxID=2184697 RepID=A0A8B2NG39_9HYPH|nr:hypothetical protein DLJ53_33740 [Acuticoccus sediminis]
MMVRKPRMLVAVALANRPARGSTRQTQGQCSQAKRGPKNPGGSASLYAEGVGLIWEDAADYLASEDVLM